MKVLNGYQQKQRMEAAEHGYISSSFLMTCQMPWHPVACLLWLPLSNVESVSNTPLKNEQCLNTVTDKTLSLRKTLIMKIRKLISSLLKISHPHPFAKYLRVIILHLLGRWDRWNKCSPILQTLVHLTSCASPTYSCVPVSLLPCCQHTHAHTHTCILYNIRQTGAKPLKSSAE